MTKCSNSKYKQANNLKGVYKNLHGVIKAGKFRSIAIVKQNSFAIKLNLKRLSPFAKALNSRQSLKNFYCNVADNSFKKLVNTSIQSQSKTINKLVSLLESRVDLILFRACFVNSLHMARQLLNHGFIYINNKQAFSSHLQLYSGDMLEIKQNNLFLHHTFKIRHFKQYYKLTAINKENSKALHLFVQSLNKKKRIVTPVLKKRFLESIQFKKLTARVSNLEINYSLLKIIFLWEPTLVSTYYPSPINYRVHLKSYIFSHSTLLYK
jgi:ribosomal protein S4